MKKSLLFILSVLAFFSCSENEITSPTNGMEGDVGHSFLSVSIVPSQTSGTRAGDEDYRDGTDVENQVENIRFYFFNKDGGPASVKANGASYYDVQKEEIIQERNENDGLAYPGPVESTISAIIVIESQKGDSKPAYMAAVLNHNGAAPTKNVSIKDLQDYVSTYSSHTEGTFTMSSSVYKGNWKQYKEVTGSKDLAADTPAEGVEFVAEPVYEFIKSSREEALRSKATIYVERVLAKVSSAIDIDKSTQEQIELTDDDGRATTIYYVGYVGDQGKGLNPEWSPAAEDKIYVKFLGWNVTADRKESRLVKKIDSQWDDTFDGGWKKMEWNNKINYRSHWAINPNPKRDDRVINNPIEDQYNFTTFNNETEKRKAALSFDFDSEGDNYYTYLQENAGKYEAGTDSDVINSKIIVAAQLVDKDGNPLSLVEWQGEVYRYGTDTEKSAILKAMAADTYLYIKNGTEWQKLGASDVKIEFDNITPADEAYAQNEEGKKRYYVTLKLTGPADAKYAIYKYDIETDKWDLDTNDGEGYTIDSETVTNAIASIGNIKYWNTGYTYYWVNIRHFGEDKDKTGYYGVVRNHWYDYTFKSVKGLGVPVADPDKVIYPEEPGEPDYFYLATEVKILSWRMVHQNTGLGW